jgi:hypothetical protein
MYYCLELQYDILERSSVLDAAIQLFAQGTTYCISKKNFEITVVQEIFYQIKTTKMVL